MRIYCLFVSAIVFILACSPTQDLTSINMAGYLRKEEQAAPVPEFEFYHLKDSLSRLYVKTNIDQLLYTRQSDGTFLASLGIHVDIIESYEVPTLIDSFTVYTSLPMSGKSPSRIFSVDFPLRRIGKLLCRVQLMDINRGSMEEYFVSFDNLNKQQRGAFLVSDRKGEPLFRNYIAAADTVNIVYRDSAVTSVWCKHYLRDFQIAAPPYGFDVRDPFNYDPDSVFRLDIGPGVPVMLPAVGFYHIQVDTVMKEGLTLYRFPGGFPNVTSATQMVEPTRYLTTRGEYDALQSASSKRQAIDAFWLKRGVSEDRTRQLIRNYYVRVQQANKALTSYTEGWRTDRGMIFVIFGPPNTIYRSSASETWIYGSTGSATALNFFFVKVDNPFTDNDFSLSRAPVYEASWNRAVEVWRQGRAFNSLY